MRLRLQRFGVRNNPFYRIVAADSRWPRDGKHLEMLGTYNPKPNQHSEKIITLNYDRIKYWLVVGAQPSVSTRISTCVCVRASVSMSSVDSSPLAAHPPPPHTVPPSSPTPPASSFSISSHTGARGKDIGWRKFAPRKT